MDVLFLTWIYLALGSTIRILTEFQQGYKLNLYKQLAFIIALFVSLFAMASILILLDRYQFIIWPLQFLWFQQVQYPLIINRMNFIFVFIILICYVMQFYTIRCCTFLFYSILFYSLSSYQFFFE